MFNPQQEINHIVSFIADRFKAAGKTTAIIGLSGGIDSAVSYALTVKALGADHVRAYHLPSKTSNPQHLQDIQLLTSDLGLNTPHLRVIPIGSIIQKSWRILKQGQDLSFRSAGMSSEREDDTSTAKLIETQRKNSDLETRKVQKLRLANLAARTRMLILFDQSKALDGLVIGTENRSETLLGYFTRFGDAASDIEPICHLYKTQVYELAKALNIPQPLVDKAPSADLWQGQTDESELGFSYAEADPILMQIDRGEIPTGPVAEKVLTKTKTAAFKQLVPYKVDSKTNLPL